jgi:hypothetical protein
MSVATRSVRLRAFDAIVGAPVKSPSTSGRRSSKGRPVHALEPAPLPDEEQYVACLEAIRGRRDKVETLQCDIERLRQSLARFESICQTRIGDLVTELRRIAEASREAQTRLAGALAAAELLADEVLDVLLEGLGPEPELDFDDVSGEPSTAASGTTDNPTPTRAGPNGRHDPASLKRLYRDLAKRCHPDLADSAVERERRAGLMQRINEAFRDGDIEALRLLLHETEADEPGFEQRSIADRLRWAREELARLDREIADLRAELLQLHVGELYRLWRRHEAGESVLDSLEDDLERRIRREGIRLDRLTLTHRRLLEQQGTPLGL